MKKTKLLSLLLLSALPLVVSCQSQPSYESVITSDVDESKILIAYFSWADNVTEFNLDDMNVDSYTGASLSVPGNGQVVAEFIQNDVGGTMHKILVDNPYSPVYDECLDRASEELADDSRPSLRSSVANFDEFEVVFLGFPNWWNHAPRAVLTFIDENDFSDKTVVPFCMHGTSGKTNPVNEVANYLPESATIMNSLGVYRPETLQSQDNVTNWLTELGFIHDESQI